MLPPLPGHPRILKHNIDVDDYIRIAPDGFHDRMFLVSKIEGGKIYMTCDTNQYILTPSRNQDEWILKSAVPYGELIDWSELPAIEIVPEIKIKWQEHDSREIIFMSRDDDVVVNYRRSQAEIEIEIETDNDWIPLAVVSGVFVSLIAYMTMNR